jgi:hypothetical protein
MSSHLTARCVSRSQINNRVLGIRSEQPLSVRARDSVSTPRVHLFLAFPWYILARSFIVSTREAVVVDGCIEHARPSGDAVMRNPFAPSSPSFNGGSTTPPTIRPTLIRSSIHPHRILYSSPHHGQQARCGQDNMQVRLVKM